MVGLCGLHVSSAQRPGQLLISKSIGGSTVGLRCLPIEKPVTGKSMYQIDKVFCALLSASPLFHRALSLPPDCRVNVKMCFRVLRWSLNKVSQCQGPLQGYPLIQVEVYPANYSFLAISMLTLWDILTNT